MNEFNLELPGIFTSNSCRSTLDLKNVDLQTLKSFFEYANINRTEKYRAAYVLTCSFSFTVSFCTAEGHTRVFKTPNWYFLNTINASPEVKEFMTQMIFLGSLENL